MILVIIIAIIACSFISGSSIETQESSSHYESIISKKDSLHAMDSIAISILQVRYDSLDKSTRVISSVDVDTEIQKRGLSTVVVVTETTYPDGHIERSTKTVTIDTTTIASFKIKTLIDSLAKETQRKIDSTKSTFVAIHDTTYVTEEKIQEVHDTLWKSTTIKISPKKMQLSAQTGIVANASPSVNPMIDVDARYTFWGPIFVSGGIGYEGNPIKYINTENYKIHTGIGARIEF